MKNLTISFVLGIFFFLCYIGPVIAKPQTFHRDSIQAIVSAKVLLSRMDSINAMDKKHLEPSEVRNLKREIRSIKGELKELEGGNYLPVGTLVLILLVPFVVFNVSQ